VLAILVTWPTRLLPITTGGALFEREEVAAAFRSNAHGVIGLWTPLGAAAGSQDGDAKVVLECLAKIASLILRPNDWNLPYGPAIRFEGRRSPMHTDLVPDELSLLAEAAPAIPHAGLRSRVFDVLSLSVSGPSKIKYAKAHIEALLDSSIDAETWSTQDEAWDRGLTVARRYGRATRGIVAKLEQVLRKIVRTSEEGFMPLQAADLLAKHNLATDRATLIGQRLLRLAARSEGERKRAYMRGAVSWIARGGNTDLAAQVTLDEVQSLVDQAEALAATGSANAMRAGHFYEEALQRLRQVSRAQRARLGVTDLPRVIAQHIRELGALSLATMNVFESDPIDLTEVVRDVRNRIKNKSIEEALRSYAGLGGWLSIDKEVKDAEKLISEHPLQSLFSNVHYSADGRITYRSSGQGGTPIYGLDPTIWDNVIRKYEWHINIIVQGALWPGWVQLTNEHQLSLGDFAAMIKQTGIVPADRTEQFGRALYYGFNGDFSTAMQLLAPQMEALVRYHFANAGEPTSTIDQTDQTETEIGLSALMQRDIANDIFTRDLAFEIRALFCGPTGPNIRNDVAHGLMSDQSTASATAIYVWWFSLRLIFITFWNSLHDVDSADAREPHTPGEGASDEDEQVG
jgi:hypothetical protein